MTGDCDLEEGPPWEELVRQVHLAELREEELVEVVERLAGRVHPVEVAPRGAGTLEERAGQSGCAPCGQLTFHIIRVLLDHSIASRASYLQA